MNNMMMENLRIMQMTCNINKNNITLLQPSINFTNILVQLETMNKLGCIVLADLLESYGVRRIVVSPGSRNAPLIVALARSGRYRLTTVIDERSAAFAALGMAEATGTPVAIVCTSGSAMLNYAPALAEAYYSRIPLIAITADRPAEWISQRDGQTIQQAGAIDSVVRCSVSLPEGNDDSCLWHINRLVNDALAAATGNIPGPVHINVPLSIPLTEVRQLGDKERLGRKISVISPQGAFDRDACSFLERRRVLMVCGAGYPADSLRQAVELVGRKSSVCVLSDILSNLPGGSTEDFTASAASLPEPEVVLTLGGLLSDSMKRYLRGLAPECVFAYIGFDDNFVDTYRHYSARIECKPEMFLRTIADSIYGDADYKDACAKVLPAANPGRVYDVMRALRDNSRGHAVHFSNGMTVRYAQTICFRGDRGTFCNRGVNGIDGSTSTAIGGAIASDSPVLFVTGDMSAAYDIGALAMAEIPSDFRMAVIDNGGGHIFRKVGTTRSLPEREQYFCVPPRLPLSELAAAYGFDFYELSPDGDIDTAIREFMAGKGRPAILKIKIDNNE